MTTLFENYEVPFAGRKDPRTKSHADELDPKFIQLTFNLTFDGARDDRDSRGSARRSHARDLVA